MNRLIALSGYARCGKDSIGQILSGCGYQRVGFADSLREVALALDPMVDAPTHSLHARLSSVVQAYGWEMAKDNYPDVRRLLQRLGTDVGRAFFGENVWVDLAMRKVAGPTVFTDCRFPNEADAIREAGGSVWRVHRHGFGPVNAHPSETALDSYDFDWHIWNNSTLDSLARQITAEVAA